jgi:hypothetical protein
LLEDLYAPFCHFVLQFHGRTLRKTYQIIYDSRNPEEDAILNQKAEEIGKLADRLHPGMYAHYKGYATDASLNSAGLRLVDLVAGEVRAFFYRNPAVLSADSTFDILSPYSNPRMIQLDGKRAPFYRRELSLETIRCFEERGRGFMLPLIKQHFACGTITYYAQQGEARHLSMLERVAYDN